VDPVGDIGLDCDARLHSRLNLDQSKAEGFERLTVCSKRVANSDVAEKDDD
jgi:hypothetical protein